ncbi:MAG: MaoC family dehydratase [Alphaproteobacteria bacterium]|nr:MAG: MaoC family dehydratase [Alphaproteobacteria bacterium]
MTHYFEDIVIAQPIELGSHSFSREEIISFASRFDPQPFHLDEDAARDSIFGGLCASGWHTASVLIRLLVQHRLAISETFVSRGQTPPSLGPSPGVRDLRWLKPVYAGDVISFSTTPLEKRVSRSRPQWGIVTSQHEGRNQKGETVISMRAAVFIERRTPLATGA